jgi:hypothetical protein
MELHTGKNICKYKRTKWFLATRGQKLRITKAQRRLYRGEIAVTKRRKKALIEDSKVAGRIGDGNNEEKHAAGAKLATALADSAIYISIMKILDDVERMALKENEDGWDWKAGLRAQLD